MTEQNSRKMMDFFAAPNGASIPSNLLAMAEESVAKSRAAYLRFNSVAQDNLKTYQDAMSAAHDGAKTIGEKVLLNTEANTKAAFDAAQAISRAKTLPEMANLQSSYLQKQAADAVVQTQGYFELSMKVAQQTIEAMNSAAAKAFDQARKAD